MVAYWGNFESLFNACLEAIVASETASGSSRKVGRWRRGSFRLRCNLFHAICDEWLRDGRPAAADTLIDVIERARLLHQQRNMIAHGCYGYTILPRSSRAVDCVAINGDTGERLQFDERVLTQLYHDISHITAELWATAATFGNATGTMAIIEDSDLIALIERRSAGYEDS